MSAANTSDPFAVDCVLNGSQAPKDRVSSLAVHGEKLYVGHPSGSLSIFRLPDPGTSRSSFSERRPQYLSSATGPSRSSNTQAELLSTHAHFHSSGKQVLSLRIVPSLSLILSFSPDGILHFNSLATLEPVKIPNPIQTSASKGVVAFEVQSSVCDWPPEEDRSNASTSEATVGRVETSSRYGQRGLVEGGKTFPRTMSSSSSITSSGRARPLSMFGRQDSSRQPPAVAEGKLRLLTTLIVSLRRKLLIIRWLDGQPFDWKELALLHTARSFAFTPPSPSPTPPSDSSSPSPPNRNTSSSTTIFISYGTPSEFGILEVPPAHLSPAATTNGSVSLPAGSQMFVKDTQEWKKLKELHIPDYAVEYPGNVGNGKGEGQSQNQAHGDANGQQSSASGADSSSTKAVTAASSASIAAAGLFGGFGGYIGLGGRSRAPILRSIPRSTNTGIDSDSEVIVVRENTAVFLSISTGNPTRRRGIEWPSPVDDAAHLPSLHLFAALTPATSQGKAAIQIRSSKTMEVVQTFLMPPDQESISSFIVSALLAPPLQSSSSSSTASCLFVVLTPLSSNESARIYKLTPRSWQVRLAEMIRLRRWEEAVGLVRSGSVDSDQDAKDVEQKKRLLPPLLALLSLDRFLAGCAASNSGASKQQLVQSGNTAFESAVDLWIDLDLNPTKVLSIFPERIAGRGLSKPRSDWIALWGEDLVKEGFDLGDGEGGSDTWLRSTSGGIPTDRDRAGTSTNQAATLPRDRTKLTSLFGKTGKSMAIAVEEGSAIGVAPDSITAMPSSPASTIGSHENTKERGSSGVESVGGVAQLDRAAKQTPAQTASRLSTTAKATAHLERSDVPSRAVSVTGSVTEAVIDLSLVENEALLSRPSLEALGRFLADRRRIFKPILEARPSVVPSPDSAMLALPSVPLPRLSISDLTALARVVDTALFKTFLETKPSLVGPLCRIENWCEVSEVEELLKAKGKFSELISLYGGKDMHDRALELLRKFSEEEDDEEEKVGPTVRYLQGLDAEHIAVILETSRWVLKQDPQRGMEIFTADTGKVSTFPRLQVVNFLWDFNRELCAIYLEHIIQNVGEGNPELHEKLAIIYLERVKTLRDGGKDGEQLETSPEYKKLLQFLSESYQYRPERILRRLPIDALWEVRAVLLGRMGQHKGALSIYVERIGGSEGEAKAEEYCTRIYEGRGAAIMRDEVGGDGINSATTAEDARGIFLLLLKLYLRPIEDNGNANKVGQQQHDLQPALRLLSRHPSSLELGAVLSLLPPLVPVSSISTFLFKGLQASHRAHSNGRIISSISREYGLQVDERLAGLRSRRVKVTPGRTCGVCGKRLGVSVLAVSNTGDAMHYGCKQ